MSFGLEYNPPESDGETPAWLRYVLSLLMVGAATVVAVIVDQVVHVPNLSLIFVLPVVIAAVSFGWKPAMSAAVAAVLAVNFFLTAPRYSLSVADPANAWGLGLLLVTAATAADMAGFQPKLTAAITTGQRSKPALSAG